MRSSEHISWTAKLGSGKKYHGKITAYRDKHHLDWIKKKIFSNLGDLAKEIETIDFSVVDTDHDEIYHHHMDKTGNWSAKGYDQFPVDRNIVLWTIGMYFIVVLMYSTCPKPGANIVNKQVNGRSIQDVRETQSSRRRNDESKIQTDSPYKQQNESTK